MRLAPTAYSEAAKTREISIEIIIDKIYKDTSVSQPYTLSDKSNEQEKLSNFGRVMQQGPLYLDERYQTANNDN